MAEINIADKTILIPESGSECEHWKLYFDQLRSALGKDNARTIWLVTWGKNSSDLCTTDADFNRWLSRNGIDVSNAATSAIADVSKIGSNLLGLGKNLTKMLSIGIPIASGILLLVIIYVIIRKARTANLPITKA